MGRIARNVVSALFAAADFDVTLVADGAAARELRTAYPTARVAPVASLGHARRYDVAWFPFNGMPRAVAARAVVTVHDAFAFSYPDAKRIARYREQAPIRRAVREAARVVTVSRYSRDEIVRTLHRSRATIDVVAPAPDPFFHAGDDDAPLPAPLDSTRYALLVGARDARKNVRLALDASAAALRAPHETLVVVGALDPHERERARRLQTPAGEIAPSDAMLRALYRRARVVLVPSLAEGFGLVAVEAMACGAPVFAATGSALDEACDGAATMLDPRDTNAWARALRAIFDDDDLAASLRARGLATSARTDRTRHERRMLDIFRTIAT